MIFGPEFFPIKHPNYDTPIFSDLLQKVKLAKCRHLNGKTHEKNQKHFICESVALLQ
jgi:hypothetical protein